MKKILLATSALIALGSLPVRADDTPFSFSVKGSFVENLGYATNYKLNSHGAPTAVRIDNPTERDDALLSAVGKMTFGGGYSLSLQGDFFGTASSLSRSSNGGCRRDTPDAVSSHCATNLGIKHLFATLGSPYGSLIVGEREDATYLLHNTAPDVSPLARGNNGFFHYWVVAPVSHRGLTTDNDSRYDDRSVKISYVTPAYQGVTAAVTYVPRLASTVGSGSPTPATAADYGLSLPGGQATGPNFGGDAVGGGLYYAHSLHGVGIKADATVLQADTANLRIWQQGVQLLYGGFTLGASSLIRDVPGDASIGSIMGNGAAAAIGGTGASAAAIAQTALFAGNAYTLGLRYAIGPYSVSASFFHDNSKSLAALNGSGRADSTDFYDLGVAYDLGNTFHGGPKATLRAGVGYVTYRGPVAQASAPYANNNDGVAAVTGIKLDF
ncbi:MAG: porin [Telmatospirillum sp.]|nr:porin [Telmatospirillum sp.]